MSFFGLFIVRVFAFRYLNIEWLIILKLELLYITTNEIHF